jgi:hypothetical protein
MMMEGLEELGPIGEGSGGGQHHQVVAMPANQDQASVHAVSVREFVSLQQQQQQQIPQGGGGRRSLTPGRRSAFQQRSKSPARNVSRSRDIVQEVYDRMGVNYVRGVNNTIELDDNTSVVSIQSGGTAGKNGGRRASITKSPGRNRSNNGNNNSGVTSVGRDGEVDDCDTTTIASKSLATVTTTGTGGGRRWHLPDKSSSNVMVTPTKTSANVISSSISKNLNRKDDGSFPSFYNSTITTTNQPTTNKADTRDESSYRQTRSIDQNQAGSREEEGEQEGRTSPVSIKSRISAFGGGKGAGNSSKVRSVKKWNPSSYRKSDSAVAASFLASVSSTSKQQGGGKKHTNGESNGGGKSVLYPTTATTTTTTTTTTTPNTKGRIPIEIHPSDYKNDPDDQSIAASSVSGEDFAGASTKGTPRGDGASTCSKFTSGGNQSVSSLSRRFGGGGNNNNNKASNNNNNNNKSSTAYKSATEQMIERIVDERVASKLQAMAETMAAEIQRLRDETKARVNELESKLMVLNLGKDDVGGVGGDGLV